MSSNKQINKIIKDTHPCGLIKRLQSKNLMPIIHSSISLQTNSDSEAVYLWMNPDVNPFCSVETNVYLEN